MTNKTAELAIITIAITFMISSAYADHLGTQTFDDINLDDSKMTPAEADLANTVFSNPGILPDNPLYFAKRVGEGIRLFFAFDPGQKTKVLTDIARTRLAEANALIKNKQFTMAQSTLADYSTDLNYLENSSKVAAKGGPKILADSHNMLEEGSLMLNLIKAQVPNASRAAIDAAINDSVEKKTILESEINWSANDMANISNKINDEKARNSMISRDMSNQISQAQGNIKAASDVIASIKNQMNGTNINATNPRASSLMTQAVQIIGMAQDAIDNNDYGAAIGLSNAAVAIASNAKRAAEPIQENTSGLIPSVRTHEDSDPPHEEQNRSSTGHSGEHD